MAASDRKEMHAKDLLEQATKAWTYGGDHFLTKLATISQLSLLDSKISDEISDEILDITTQQVLLKVRTPAEETDHGWQSDSQLDEECQAKSWALKTLVNRLRATEDAETAKRLAIPVYKLLNTLIVKEGELSKQNDTPTAHKSHLRLLASQLMLKLCTRKMFDDVLTPTEFNRIAFVAQDRMANVRRGFIEKLQKYLVKGRLSNRFYTIIFLTAYEPELDFKNSIITWTRSRAKIFAEKKSHVMESVFARLLSLLAHHPDYSTEPDELLDHARYILYYISTVASEDNLALIYKYAERVKQARDGISDKDSDRLYVLSDLAQAVIRLWEEKKGWSMQTWPLKVGLPNGLFAALPNHEVAQEIANRQYLPENIEDLLNALVRNADKKKVCPHGPIYSIDYTKFMPWKQKRKSDDRDDDGQPSVKKIKPESKSKTARISEVKKEKVAKEKKTPAKPKKRKSDSSTPATSERRKSSRVASARKSYADRDDSEDEDEMMEGVARWKYVDEVSEEEQSENVVESPAEEEEVTEEKLATPEVVEDEPEPESEQEQEPESEPERMDSGEAEVDPTPPRSNSKRSRVAPKKGTPVVTASKVTKQKPTAKVAVVKPKAKTPLVAKSKSKAPVAKPVSKGKGKSKAKDIFDMDESE